MMNGNNAHNHESEPWLELGDRLKNGILIVAEDLVHINREYLILPTQELRQPNKRSSTDEQDASTAVPESSQSPAGPVKKTTETFHLLVKQKKGQGGFGVVYRVQKNHPIRGASQEICLKQARSNSWDSLLHENEIFNVLHDHPHENIIRRDFMCRSKHDTFLGINYFDGHTLSDIISVNINLKRKIGHKDLVNILEQQTNAIDHLQRNGIYHCDIKPDNIIYHCGREMSKLIDFGLAVHRFGSGERFKSQGGTTEYMAPETLMDSELDIGSDLYGLAATVHHLVTLQAPWFSVERVRQSRDQKLDKNAANYQELSRLRRARIRQSIKDEINRYRGEAAEAIGSNEPEPHMAIQLELWNHQGTCVPELKQILCLMLHHTSSERLVCADILTRLRSTVHRDLHVHRQMSQSQHSLASNDSSVELTQTPSSSSAQSYNPVCLDWTDINKSTETNVAVTSSTHSGQNNLPDFQELMENSSAQQPGLSQLMSQGSTSQPASDRNMVASASRYDYPTSEMASLKLSQPVSQHPEDEYNDHLPRTIDEFYSYGILGQSIMPDYNPVSPEYVPGPNQPTARQDPTGMTDYVQQQRSGSAPPSDTIAGIEDVMADGNGSFGHDSEEESYANFSVQRAGIGAYTPTTPNNQDIHQVQEEDDLDL